MTVVCAPLNVTHHLRSISQNQLQQIQKQQLKVLRNELPVPAHYRTPTATPPVTTPPHPSQYNSIAKTTPSKVTESAMDNARMTSIVEEAEEEEEQKLCGRESKTRVGRQENIEIVVDPPNQSLYSAKDYGTFGNNMARHVDYGLPQQQHDYKDDKPSFRCVAASVGIPVVVLQNPAPAKLDKK